MDKKITITTKISSDSFALKDYFSKINEHKLTDKDLVNLSIVEIVNLKSRVSDNNFLRGLYAFELNVFRDINAVGKFFGLKNKRGFLNDCFEVYRSPVLKSENDMYSIFSKLNMSKSEKESKKLLDILDGAEISVYGRTDGWAAGGPTGCVRDEKYNFHRVKGPNGENNFKLFREDKSYLY